MYISPSYFRGHVAGTFPTSQARSGKLLELSLELPVRPLNLDLEMGYTDTKGEDIPTPEGPGGVGENFVGRQVVDIVDLVEPMKVAYHAPENQYDVHVEADDAPNSDEVPREVSEAQTYDMVCPQARIPPRLSALARTFMRKRTHVRMCARARAHAHTHTHNR